MGVGRSNAAWLSCGFAAAPPRTVVSYSSSSVSCAARQVGEPAFRFCPPPLPRRDRALDKACVRVALLPSCSICVLSCLRSAMMPTEKCEYRCESRPLVVFFCFLCFHPLCHFASVLILSLCVLCEVVRLASDSPCAQHARYVWMAL